jgi:hypothetical protein
MAGNGSPAAQSGCAIHLYAANRDDEGRYFYNADGELLIVPQQGRLRIATELGISTSNRRKSPSSRAACASRSACRTAKRAAMSARISARCCACRTWA